MNVDIKGKYCCKIGIDNPKCELSKRELIAAMALQGFLSSGACDFNHEEFTTITASNSVIMADALLDALKS